MSGTRIISVTAREVYSDRMHAAVQATVSTENGAVGKALIGDGISVGSHESPFLYDGGRRFAGRGMTCAAEKIVQVIAPMLIGLEADNQMLRFWPAEKTAWGQMQPRQYRQQCFWLEQTRGEFRCTSILAVLGP